MESRKRLASRPPLAETTNVPKKLKLWEKEKEREADKENRDLKDRGKEREPKAAIKERISRDREFRERESNEKESKDRESKGREVKETNDTKGRSGRLVGDELKSWQASWRKIMRESVVYFDTQGCDSSNASQTQEQKRAQRALRLVGCEVVPFYDRDVSIIISRRPFNNTRTYSPNDIFHDAATLKIKVWDYDKVFRFLRNLGVESTTTERHNLLHLLKEEKIFGATDRDPAARRDDLHYLDKHYVYVYDLAQAVRPIAVREWSGSYPAIHMTLDGKCPFMPDTQDNLERKKARRRAKLESTREYREHLRQAAREVLPPTSDTSSATVARSDVSPYDFKAPELARQSLAIPGLKFYDVAASGYNGASTAAQYLMDLSLNSGAGNGLGPTVALVVSRNINNLKRRIFMKRQKQPEREREMRPGYCENCRVKYDHFDDHIESNRHRNFACNDKNFAEIDALIATLNESKSMGYVASNGDYVASS